ncbi:MAG: DUF4214 domain-containing protein [Chlorobiaceae bacterium]
MPSPYTSSATTTFTESGINTIDSLLNPDHQKWSFTSPSEVDLTYSFPWLNGTAAYWQNNYSQNSEPQASVHIAFNTTEITAAGNALQAWANVASITFTKVADTASNVGDFRFAFSSSVAGNSWGYTNYPNSDSASAADIWLNPASAAQVDWSNKSYNYFSLMHEIGHGLGLKHPGNYNAGGGSTPGPYLSTDLDFRNYSIMSYNNYKYLYWDTTQSRFINVYPETPMVYDIEAIQYLYGANNNYKTGNDTYLFDPTVPFYKTIWDAGGNDTIDISNFTIDSTIDLRPGHYSSIHYPTLGADSAIYDGTNNLGIAFGVTIENATGGSGNDNIIGNTAGNTLIGGNGNDTIIGGGGNDSIDGGQGIDTIVFSGNQSQYAITQSGTGFSITDSFGTNGNITEINVEKFQFTDKILTVAATPSATLAEAYRMYKAAFDRSPDYSGLGFWYNALNNGESLPQVAANFINSSEFKTMYGDNPSDNTFVTLLYQHVLGRTPDQSGYDFWINSLHTISRAQELTYFSESAENKAAVTGIITNGIIYQEYTA